MRVCVLLPEAYQWFMGCALSKCEHITGIEWIQANTKDSGGTPRCVLLIVLCIIFSDISSMLQSADIVVSEPVLIAKNLPNLNNTKWVHSIWAGNFVCMLQYCVSGC